MPRDQQLKSVGNWTLVYHLH